MIKRITLVLLYFLLLISSICGDVIRSRPVNTDGVVIEELSCPAEPPRIALAGAKLQQISHYMLSYTATRFADELRAFSAGELRKSLKLAVYWNILHQAVFTDNAKAVEVLIRDFGFDPNEWSPNFGTCAYLVKSVRMVKMLQRYNCDFSILRPCVLYDSPLDSALKRQNLAFFASQSDEANRERIANFVVILRSTQQQNPPEMMKGSKKSIFSLALTKMAACQYVTKPNAMLKIKYDGQMGVDAGGLTYDFMNYAMEELIKDKKTLIFRQDRSIYDFQETADRDRIRLVGFLVGLSLINNNPLGVVFAPIVYELMLAKNLDKDTNFVALAKAGSGELEASIDNIREMDNVTLNSLEYIDDQHCRKRRFYPFILDRRSIPDYLQNLSKHLVYDSKREIYTQFLIGLDRAIDSSRLSEFLSTENLKQIIFGHDKDYSGSDLMNNLRHFSGFGDDRDRLFRWFTEIINEIGPEKRAEFLDYSMAMKRLPFGGFSELLMKFAIEVLVLDVNRIPNDFLPTVSTCTNTLYLPKYTDKEAMRTQLLKAMENSKVFSIE